MIDADEPCPFTIGGEWRLRREVAEFLEDVDALLKSMPETGPQSLNGLHVALLLLAHA